MSDFNRAVHSRDGDERDTDRLGMFVHETLDIGRHSGRALVEDAVSWAMVTAMSASALPLHVQQASHPHALLLASGEDVLPLLASLPSALSSGKICEVDMFQNAHELAVGPATRLHLGISVRAVGELR